MREQRKEGASERPYEGIDSNGTVRVEAVAIDEIAETLPERYHASQTDEGDREDLRYPINVRVACPRKPDHC